MTSVSRKIPYIVINRLALSQACKCCRCKVTAPDPPTTTPHPPFHTSLYSCRENSGGQQGHRARCAKSWQQTGPGSKSFRGEGMRAVWKKKKNPPVTPELWCPHSVFFKVSPLNRKPVNISQLQCNHRSAVPQTSICSLVVFFHPFKNWMTIWSLNQWEFLLLHQSTENKHLKTHNRRWDFQSMFSKSVPLTTCIPHIPLHLEAETLMGLSGWPLNLLQNVGGGFSAGRQNYHPRVTFPHPRQPSLNVKANNPPVQLENMSVPNSLKSFLFSS